MGLLGAGAYAPGQGMPTRPRFMQQGAQQPPQMGQQMPGGPMPQMPQGSLLNAFSGNPQFQQQLQGIQNQQSPGYQPVQFTPPAKPLDTTVPDFSELWHDGIAGNAVAMGLTRPHSGANRTMGYFQPNYGASALFASPIPQRLFG